MRLLSNLVLGASAICGLVAAQGGPSKPPMTGVEGNQTIAGNGPAPAKTGNFTGKYLIQAEGIKAYFVPYGASISNLLINDTKGVQRDVVLGWDNATYYTLDRQHPYFGPVVGRYANRIKNNTFTIDGTSYHTAANENGGNDTLHGGLDGWSWRNWTIVTHTTDSITFNLVDVAGDQGFPGQVLAYVTYTVTPYEWHISMTAISTEQATPIMLSSHTYWNLDGFQNPSTPLVLNHSLYMPYAGQRVGCDGSLIPNGTILNNAQYSVNDFWTTPKQIGANFTAPDALGNCGTNCTGYDTCYINNRQGPSSPYTYDWNQAPVTTLMSNWSGIRVDVYTDQEAFQIYSCGGQNGSVALKGTQGLFGNSSRPRVVEQYGCVVMEVEDWIGGINYPEWGRDSRQIYGPGDAPYSLNARYSFSVGSANNQSAYIPYDYTLSGMNYGGMNQKRGLRGLSKRSAPRFF